MAYQSSPLALVRHVTPAPEVTHGTSYTARAATISS